MYSTRDELKKWIQKGQNLDQKWPTNDSITVLMHYAIEEDAEIVELLLKTGADPHIERCVGYRPQTALSLCRDNNGTTCAALLLEHKANPDCNANGIQNLLDWLVCHNKIDHVKLLLKHRASLEVTNSEGKTPIHTAYLRKSIACFQLLVDAGAKTEGTVSEFSGAADLLSRRGKTMQAARITYWIVKKRLGRDMARLVARMVWCARWE